MVDQEFLKIITIIILTAIIILVLHQSFLFLLREIRVFQVSKNGIYDIYISRYAQYFWFVPDDLRQLSPCSPRFVLSVAFMRVSRVSFFGKLLLLKWKPMSISKSARFLPSANISLTFLQKYSLKLLQMLSQIIVESDYHANRLTSLTSISIHRCRFLN